MTKRTFGELYPTSVTGTLPVLVAKDGQSFNVAFSGDSDPVSAAAYAALAKDWATKTSDEVVVGEGYGAKKYSQDAKDWATKTDAEVVVGQGYGAKKYAEDAAASLAAFGTAAAHLNSFVASNTDLIAAKISDYPNGLWRLYHTSGTNVAPLFFMPQSGNAAANGLVSNGGTCQDNSEGNSWVAKHGPMTNEPGQYGVFTECGVDSYGMYVSGNDNSTVLQAWIDAPTRFGPKVLPPGNWAFKNLTLPDWVTTDQYYSFDGPLSIMGVPNQSRLIQMASATSGHAIAHPHVGSTSTTRGQHYGVRLFGIVLVGPGDMSQPMNGWGIENTTNFSMAECWTWGFPRGCGLQCYAHVDGGMYGSLLFNNVWGRQVSSVSGTPSTNFVDPAVYLKVTNEVHVLLNGPYDAGGKCNDTLFIGNRFLSAQVGSVRVVGHGTMTTAGSSYNTILRDNMHNLQESKKIEEGVVSATTSTTVFTLRTDAPAENRIANLYVNYILYILDASNRIVEARRISAFTSGGQVTLATALTTAPTAGTTKYRIGYARTGYDISTEVQFDPTNASFNRRALYHGVYWAQPDGQLVFEDYCEETYCAVLVSATAGTKVNIAPRNVVSEGVVYLRIDDGYWRPRDARLGGPIGEYYVTPDRIQGGHTLIGDVQNTFNPAGDLLDMENQTGATLAHGDVVRYGQNAELKTATTAAYYKHFVVQTRGAITDFPVGELTPVAYNGIADIKIDITTSGRDAALTDVLIPITGSTAAKAIDPSTLTVAQVPLIIGRPRAATTAGTGTQIVSCFVGI